MSGVLIDFAGQVLAESTNTWLRSERWHEAELGTGLRLAAGEVAQVPGGVRPAVIALHFERFTDGRGYSQARELRRTGWAGELRATGEVLIDQLVALRRVGFSQFELRADQDLGLAEHVLKRAREFYQAAGEGELPVYRRHARPAAQEGA